MRLQGGALNLTFTVFDAEPQQLKLHYEVYLLSKGTSGRVRTKTGSQDDDNQDSQCFTAVRVRL